MLPFPNSKANKNIGQNCSTYSFTITKQSDLLPFLSAEIKATARNLLVDNHVTVFGNVIVFFWHHRSGTNAVLHFHLHMLGVWSLILFFCLFVRCHIFLQYMLAGITCRIFFSFCLHHNNYSVRNSHNNDSRSGDVGQPH